MARSPESGKHLHDASPVEIRALSAGEQGAAVVLLAAGMRDNPLHVRVFGGDPDARERRLQRFLGPMLAYVRQNGVILGAHAEGRLIGVLGLINPGLCRPGLAARLRIGAEIAAGTDPFTLARIYRWLRAWELSEPSFRHFHVGPLAVAAPYRRRGIGSLLMAAGCKKMDAGMASGWLETDLEVNVEFYRRFGFTVASRKSVLGVPNWFMSRPENRKSRGQADPVGLVRYPAKP